jgi:integrase
LPALFKVLKVKPSISSMALEFCILTVARKSEVLLAKWDEIDFANRVWIVPAIRMKMEREHRVPLSPCALEILNEIKGYQLSSEWVFTNRKNGKHLSDLAMLMCLRGFRPGFTVHGTARSSFRDWCGEQTDFSR